MLKVEFILKITDRVMKIYLIDLIKYLKNLIKNYFIKLELIKIQVKEYLVFLLKYRLIVRDILAIQIWLPKNFK